MPISLTAANDGLSRVVMGTLHLHIHSGGAAAGNIGTWSGYAPIQIVAADWELVTIGSIRRIRNRRTLNWPTPGGTGPEARFVGAWTKADLSDDPVDPPGLVRNFPITDRFTVEANGSIQCPPGELQIEVGIES